MVYYLSFPTFSSFLFRMRLNPEKRPAGLPKSGKKPEIVVDGAPGGRSPDSTPLGCAMSAPFGDPRGGDINNHDLKDVQSYPVELWPESRRRGEGNSPFRDGEDHLAADLVL